ncbi:hypothetical protein M0Q50_09790 [bacterium]|jgi:hypothetical protein|nr:hypothetical protein [bacterium]
MTIEGTPRLKKTFLNLKLFSIINIPDILMQHGYSYSTMDEYSSFIITTYINDLIKTYSKSKRIRGIIYSNPYIDENIISNIYELLSKNENIHQIVLFDDYNVPKLQNLYQYFDEIIFFPSVKKIRLIEAQKFSNLSNIEWKK